MEDKKLFASFGFLYDEKTQSVLLHLRDDKTQFDPDRWAFFGGASENNESPKECFIRELEEETGIKVTEEETVSLYDYFNRGLETYRFVFFVKKRIERSEILLTEGRDCAWVSLDEAFSYDLTEKTRKDLEFFVKNEKEIAKNY